MTELRIELLGGFRVAAGGRGIPDEVWRRRKTAALVKLLALASRHRLHREQLMELLWPELAPDAAAANLRKVVHLARRASTQGDGEGAIGSEGELLYLKADDLWVDVDAFQADAARARQSRDPSAYRQAIDLHGEGLLPDDRYEDWVVGRRDELQEEYVALLEEFAALLEGQGDIAEAADATRRLIATDPLQEQAHIRLMRLYDNADSLAIVARLHRRIAGAMLAQHGAEPAEEHLAAAESMTADPAERARLACLRANQAWERGDFELAERLARQARELAVSDGTPDDVAAADEALAIVSHFRGDWRNGLRLEIARAGPGSSENAALARVFDIHHCIGQYHLYGDGLADDVEDYARRVLALADEAGSGTSAGVCVVPAGRVAAAPRPLRRGRWLP